MLFTKSVGLAGWFRLVGWPLGFRLLETLVRVALLLLRGEPSRVLKNLQESPKILRSQVRAMVWIGLVLPAGVAMLLPRLPHDHGLTSHGRPWAVASWTRVLSTGSNFEVR